MFKYHLLLRFYLQQYMNMNKLACTRYDSLLIVLLLFTCLHNNRVKFETNMISSFIRDENYSPPYVNFYLILKDYLDEHSYTDWCFSMSEFFSFTSQLYTYRLKSYFFPREFFNSFHMNHHIRLLILISIAMRQPCAELVA